MRTTSAGLEARVDSYSPLDEFRWNQQLLKEYATKQISYPDDILNTFTGVQTGLQNIFHWNLFSGIPQSLSDLKLLWNHSFPTAKLKLVQLDRAGAIRSSSAAGSQACGLVVPIPRQAWFGSIEHNDLWLYERGIECSRFEENYLGKTGLLDPFESSLVSEDSYFISNKPKQRCGMLVGLSTQDELCRSGKHLKLSQLSTWRSNNSVTANGPLLAYLLDDGNRLDEHLFDESFKDQSCCIFNIMLVRSVGAL